MVKLGFMMLFFALPFALLYVDDGNCGENFSDRLLNGEKNDVVFGYY